MTAKTTTRHLFPNSGNSTLGTSAVILLYAAIYLKDWASAWISSSTAGVVLGIALAIGYVSLAVKTKHNINPKNTGAFFILIITIIALLFTLLLTGKINTSSYYIAVPCAFMVLRTNPQLFIRLMLFHLGLTVTIEAAEYFSGNYFFVYQADDGTALDESLFGGGLDIFRAKGMFQGPLSAVAFALWIAFLFRGSIAAVAALFFVAFFASGRLGMLTSVCLMGVRILGTLKAGKVATRLLPFIAVLGTAATALFLYADENRLFFISSALDLDNDQNLSRVYFWLTSLTYYFSYSPLEMIFGNFGFIFLQEGGTENDFLRLLLDCGLIGFLLYSSSIAVLIKHAIKTRDNERFFVAILIIVLMNIFPFVQSLSSAVLFWIYFFSIQKVNEISVPSRSPDDSSQSIKLISGGSRCQ